MVGLEAGGVDAGGRVELAERHHVAPLLRYVVHLLLQLLKDGLGVVAHSARVAVLQLQR